MPTWILQIYTHSFYRYTHSSSITDEYKCRCFTCTCRAAGQSLLAAPAAVHHADNATIWPCLYKVLKWMAFLFLKLCAHLSGNQALDLLLCHEEPVFKKNDHSFKMNEREFLCWWWYWMMAMASTVHFSFLAAQILKMISQKLPWEPFIRFYSCIVIALSLNPSSPELPSPQS